VERTRQAFLSSKNADLDDDDDDVEEGIEFQSAVELIEVISESDYHGLLEDK